MKQIENRTPDWYARRDRLVDFLLKEAASLDPCYRPSRRKAAGEFKKNDVIDTVLRTLSNLATLGRDARSGPAKLLNRRMSEGALVELNTAKDAGAWQKKVTNEHPLPINEIWQRLCTDEAFRTADRLWQALEEHPMVTVLKEEDRNIAPDLRARSGPGRCSFPMAPKLAVTPGNMFRARRRADRGTGLTA